MTRYVNYSIDDNTGKITPSLPQYGGVRGEHQCAKLTITVTNGAIDEEDIVRLSFLLGDGSVVSSDILDVAVDGNTATVSYTLPQLLTQTAGQLCVRLVLSRMDENGNETVTWRSDEMVVWFEDAGLENGTPFWMGVSEMLCRTVTAKDTAVAAAEEANEHRQDADAASQSAQSAAKEAIDAKDTAVAAADAALLQQRFATESAKRAQAAADTAETASANAVSAASTAVTAKEDAESAARTAQTAKEEAVTAKEEAMRVLFTLCGGKRYRGAMSGLVAYNLIDKQEGDVFFCNDSDEQCFYIYNGSNWEPFVFNGTCYMRYRGMMSLDDVQVLEDERAGDVIYCNTVGSEGFFIYNGKRWDAVDKKGGSGSGGGTDGITPHIGDNGNWFIGETDTGVKAQGESGVYVVGNGERPASCRVQIDPSGDALAFDPDPATDDMTQPVGVTKDGKFVTKPTGGGGTVSADWEYIGESTPDNQLIFESGKYKEFYVSAWFQTTSKETNRYMCLALDGEYYLQWNNITDANTQSYWGLFNRKMSISYATKNQASYSGSTNRGNGSIAMAVDNTESLGTCFWFFRTAGSADNVIEDFGIKLWGRT